MMTKSILQILFLSLIALATAKKEAKCTLKADSPSTASGSLTITQENSLAAIMITGTITNVSPSNAEHGFHVHENGVIEPSCDAAGVHFNPNNRSHGPPTNP